MVNNGTEFLEGKLRTVYLHVGMPKTATTALQNFLPLNNTLLNSKGFDYPEMPFRFDGISMYRNGHFLTFWNTRRKHPEWAKGLEIVESSFRKYPNVILSDESLWSRQRIEKFWHNIKRAFRKMDVSIRVIVYLRRQDEQLESHWNQKVKNFTVSLPLTFDEYIASGRYTYMPFEYDKALDRIAARIGKDNLIVRVYDRRQFVGGSIFSDFLDALGLELSDEFESLPYTSNVRLPNNAVEIKRQINSLFYKTGVHDFYCDAILDAFGMELMKERPRTDTSMFSPELRAEFMERYSKGNAYVAREYLGREDGVLFEEESAPVQWRYDDREMMEDAVRILAAGDTYLFRQQEEMHRKLAQINEALPVIMYNRLTGRKGHTQEES